MIAAILTNTKAFFVALFAVVVAILAAIAYYFKLSAESAEKKLNKTKSKLATAKLEASASKERVERHVKRQQIEDDVYSASESDVDERLRDYYRD